MSRRGESIFKRSDGRWEARYIHHYENNKAVYKYIYAKTYSDVKFKKNEAIKNLEQELKNKDLKDITFYDITKLWFTEKSKTIKLSSLGNYSFIIKKYLYPKFGLLNVSKINLEMIDKFIYNLKNNSHKCLANKTIIDIFNVLKSILQYGYKKNYKCIDVSVYKIVRIKQTTKVILSSNSQKLIEKKIFKYNNRITLGILITLYTGIRIGELCGLRFEDIDFNNNTIYIKRTLERVRCIESKSKTKIIINEPKTVNSKRIIPISIFLIEYIKRFKSDNNCYILTGTTKYIEPHLMYMKYKSFMKELNLENYTFHDLRHTFATRCINEGFDIKSLSEILGHSNISTTLSVYVHPTLDQKRKQMEKLKLYV